MPAKLISIIGAVGVGKTTLAEMLRDELGAMCLLEDYSGNPFLADSYRGVAEFDLPAQLYFINSRVAQMNLMAWPENGIFVSDYGFAQDRIFAEWKLKGEDLQTYRFISSKLARFIKQPDFIIHLDAGADTLKKRLNARGRDYETTFSTDFLEYLRKKQFDIAIPENCGFLRIDCDLADFREPNVLAGIIDKVRGCLK